MKQGCFSYSHAFQKAGSICAVRVFLRVRVLGYLSARWYLWVWVRARIVYPANLLVFNSSINYYRHIHFICIKQYIRYIVCINLSVLHGERVRNSYGGREHVNLHACTFTKQLPTLTTTPPRASHIFFLFTLINGFIGRAQWTKLNTHETLKWNNL